MADTLTPAERSERMSRIRGRDTGPEWIVRRLVHCMGYRYRRHRQGSPGKTGLGLSFPPEGHFRPWLFLAYTPCPEMQACPSPEVSFGFLANQTRRQPQERLKNLEKLQKQGWNQ